MMTDYATGIIYGTGCIVKDKEKKYLIVRNLDPYYVKTIEKEVPYKAYKSEYNTKRDGKPQWCIKVRNIEVFPSLSEIQNKKDFIRAYMELHAILDLMNVKNRRGDRIKKLRFRIYGNEELLNWINYNLPADIKKIQYIRNAVDKKFNAETGCIYYQSRKEILKILKWIDGTPRHEGVWDRWQQTVSSVEQYA